MNFIEWLTIGGVIGLAIGIGGAYLYVRREQKRLLKETEDYLQSDEHKRIMEAYKHGENATVKQKIPIDSPFAEFDKKREREERDRRAAESARASQGINGHRETARSVPDDVQGEGDAEEQGDISAEPTPKPVRNKRKSGRPRKIVKLDDSGDEESIEDIDDSE